MIEYFLMKFIVPLLLFACLTVTASNALSATLQDDELNYQKIEVTPDHFTVPRSEFVNKLHGFWLAQSIANWTGLITETRRNDYPFYTDMDWNNRYQIFFSDDDVFEANSINFMFVDDRGVWGADDDTDIEYMYQHLLDENNSSILSAEQIRDGWMRHIHSAENQDNFLWVSNENAYYLMRYDGLLPPATSEPENNRDFIKIDAQLTTEIFGLLAPGRPDIVLKMAHLPIRTTAKNEAEWIAEFYVIMHSLASVADPTLSMKEKLQWMAEKARTRLPENSYPAKMYDFIKEDYENNIDKDDWEKTRDAIYIRYQRVSRDGYFYESEYDAGINFAASLVSLFYGEGDLLKTIKIGTLAGWDSDNPTATWGGLIGFMLGKNGVEDAFNKKNFSENYWIGRTRRGFPDHTPDRFGEDTFTMMAERGMLIIDRVVIEEMGGGVDLEQDRWVIPDKNSSFGN